MESNKRKSLLWICALHFIFALHYSHSVEGAVNNEGTEKTPPTNSKSDFSSMNKDFKYVRGIYEVPDTPTSLPVIYDSYFSLIYEFHLPKWNATSMKIQFWKDHNNCTESDKIAEGYPCPIMFHMNKLIEEFTGNMTMWKNLFLPVENELSSKNKTKQPYFGPHYEDSAEEDDADEHFPYLLYSSSTSHIQNAEYYCSRITPHFSTFQTTPERIEEYFQLMNNCGNDTIRKTVHLNATALKIEDMYHSAFASFTGDYWDKLPDMTRKAMASTMWTTLQSSLMLHQFMETQKWSQAISNCQKGQIPWTLLDHKSLIEAIKSSTHHSLNLAIPLDEISKYFNLPLTDCVFVGDESLIVRILIPLNVISLHPYRIIRFEPIIFHEDGEFCWFDGIRDKRFIADYQDDLYYTDCSDQEQLLCKTSDKYHSSQDKADPCALSLYGDWEEDIVKSCFLKCIPADERKSQYSHFDLSYITEDNYIFAATDEKVELRIECEGKTSQILPKLEFGAWNITLPCGCKLTGFDDQLEYPVHPPCGQTLSVEKIRPYHWRNMSITKLKMGIEGLDKSLMRDGSESQASSHFMERLDERYGSSSFQLVMLWILVVLLTGTVGFLSFIVFRLHQWKQHEVYKENRLIYSVGGVGDMVSLENRY